MAGLRDVSHQTCGGTVTRLLILSVTYFEHVLRGSGCETNWWTQLQHTDLYLVETKSYCKGRKGECSSKPAKIIAKSLEKKAKSKLSQGKKKDTNNPFHSKRNSNLKFLLLQSKKNPFSLKGKNTQHVRYPGKGWRQKQGLVGSATGKLLQKKQAGASFRANKQPGKGGLRGGGLYRLEL